MGFFFIPFQVTTSSFNFRMRVPLFIAIPSCLLITLLTWWLGTRHTDFLTPPSNADLNNIRIQALASLPISNAEKDAISIRISGPELANLTPNIPKPYQPIEIGDLSEPQRIDTYSDRASEGAGKLLGLAKALEERGKTQRALLAYERVLDLSEANPEQIYAALTAIRRIKPALPKWKPGHDPQYHVTIHLSTGPTFAESLPTIMETLTKRLAFAASGLVKFSYQTRISQSAQAAESATTVAVWMTEAQSKKPSTDVMSFTSKGSKPLTEQLNKTIFNLIRSHLLKTTSYNPAPEANVEPSLALESNITRLLWTEFGKSLQPAEAGQ